MISFVLMVFAFVVFCFGVRWQPTPPTPNWSLICLGLAFMAGSFMAGMPPIASHLG